MLRSIAIVLVLSLGAAPAFAKGKPATAKPAKSHESHQSQAANDAHKHGGQTKGQGQHGHEGEPAGWDEGKKTGWGDCDAPPGQEQKTGIDCGKQKGSKQVHGKKPAKSNKPKSQTTGTHSTTPVKTTAKPTATSTSTKTTTTTKTTTATHTRTSGAPSGEDRIEAAKKR
jgi:hypothetical protein